MQKGKDTLKGCFDFLVQRVFWGGADLIDPRPPPTSENTLLGVGGAYKRGGGLKYWPGGGSKYAPPLSEKCLLAKMGEGG